MLRVLKSYSSYGRGQLGNVVASVILSVIQAALLIPIALTVQTLFDRVLPEQDVRGLVFGAILIPALFAANGAVALLTRHMNLRAVKTAVGNLRTDLLKKAICRTRERYSQLDAAATHDHIVQDTERVDRLANAVLSQFLPAVIVSLALALMLLRQDVGLFLLLLICAPLAYGASRLVGAALKRSIRKFHQDFSSFSQGALFVLQFAELIGLSAAEKPELERQRRQVEAVRKSSGWMAWMYSAYWVLQGNVIVLVGAAVLLVGGLQTLRGTLTVGALLSFYVNLNLLTNHLRTVSNSIPTIIEGRESLLALQPLLEDDARPSAGSAFDRLRSQIDFQDVSFSHPESNFVMRNVSFTVNKNELFGIFGPSGSGKTTLVRLLTGQYEPKQGQISIDGQDIRAFDGSSFRKRIGVLSQDVPIFPGTVRENLTYGLDEVDEARLTAVCRICRIDGFIEQLADKYDTVVGDFGARLSGGQKQRLALVRALLRQPDLLILDEPDNNLGTALITEIIQDIRRLPLTVIIISHNERLMSLVDRHYSFYETTLSQRHHSRV